MDQMRCQRSEKSPGFYVTKYKVAERLERVFQWMQKGLQSLQARLICPGCLGLCCPSRLRTERVALPITECKPVRVGCPQETCQYSEPYRFWQSFFGDNICLEVLSSLIFNVSLWVGRQHMLSCCPPDTAEPLAWSDLGLEHFVSLSFLPWFEQMVQITMAVMLKCTLTNIKRHPCVATTNSLIGVG